MMAHFCELDAASRIITAKGSDKSSIATHGHVDNEEDEYEMSRSNVARMFSTTASQGSTSSYHSDDHHRHHQSPIRTGQSPPYSISSSLPGSSSKKKEQQQQQHTSIENNTVRPAFHIQKRAELQQLVTDLSKKLHRATIDLHDAVKTIHGSEEAIKVLAAQVDELIREREEQEEQERGEGEEEREHDEEKAISPTTIKKEEDESSSLTIIIQRLKQEVAGLESQVELRTTELRDKEAEMEKLMREVEAGDEMGAALRAELDKVMQLLSVEKKERKEDGERSRGDHKVLAREIKLLRLKVVGMEKENERERREKEKEKEKERREEEGLGGGINDDAIVVGNNATSSGGGPVSLI